MRDLPTPQGWKAELTLVLVIYGDGLHPGSNHSMATRPGVEPTASRSQVQRPNRYSSKRRCVSDASEQRQGEAGGAASTTADNVATDPGSGVGRRRMSAAERRRLKNELLSSSSLEVS